MILCIYVWSVVISPFSFLILLIWFFCLCFLMSLANGLPIYLLKEPGFSFVDFCYSLLCLFFIYFCHNFLRFLSFYWPWGSSFLLFLVALGVELGYWFDFFSGFLRYACIAMNFPLSTAFTVCHRFWVVVFSFSFISMHILISFLISSVICWLFSSVLFSLHMLEFLIIFLL